MRMVFVPRTTVLMQVQRSAACIASAYQSTKEGRMDILAYEAFWVSAGSR